MRKLSTALVAGVTLAAGCKESPFSPPVDAPTVDALSGALTRSALGTLVTGLLAQDRALIGGSANYTYNVLTQILSRDLYRIDASEPRYVLETLGGPPDPGSFSGSGGWTNGYVAIRSANTILASLPSVAAEQASVGEKSATAGFVRTIKALEYYRLLELRDTIGIAIQPADPAVVGAITCKPNVINYIAALLDSANADLTAAGASTTLPVTLPSGFTTAGPGGINFATQPNLVRLNRGLKGKVDVYRGLLRPTPVSGALAAAITELTTFLNGAAPGAVDPSTFSQGAYVTFVSGAENTPNPLFDSRIGLNPKAAATATTAGAFGGILAGDTRSSKFVSRSALSGNGVSTSLTLRTAATADASNATKPLAILRVEEAVLLRAQAYLESGQIANALADINSVHKFYNNGATISATDAATVRQALLYNKRYSLIGEGPQRLVDLRAYGLLKSTNTPAELATDPFNTAFPIPKGEADARGGAASIQLACQ
jgi:starch-binding outer membrane protein, SusD/RagB family